MNVANVVFALGVLALAPVGQAVAQEELGPLARVVDQQLLKGWQGGSQDGWYVLLNKNEAGAEQTFLVDPGPPPSQGRTTTVNVSLSSTNPEAAIGILTRNQQTGDLCLMEITADATANLFCLVDGKKESIASVANSAKMDGSDIIEMFEIPGAARFLLNGTQIGDAHFPSALGSEVGIMAYERGTFGLADFTIVDEKPEPASGSGLPPKGGASGGSATPSPLPPKGGAGGTTAASPAPQSDGSTDNRTKMSAIMGPLAEAIMAAPDKEGWQLAFEGNWFVLVNEEKASGEVYITAPVNPLTSGERVTTLSVGILPQQGKTTADVAKSALGVLLENYDTSTSCVGEITGAGDGVAMCFNADGNAEEIGRLPGAALGGGKDVIELIERPGSAEFRLNGKSLARIENHLALGGEIGFLAYERGEFYLGDFSVSSSTGSANGKAPGGGVASAGTTGGTSGPLPKFGNVDTRLIGVYLGLTNGIFMHEFGHALIGELQVPSTGPEEDAVDIFSALRVVEPTMYPSGDASIDAIGREVAIYSALPWYYGGLISEKRGTTTPWQDEHTGDLKRFRNVFCVIYGGNPSLYAPIAKDVGMEERTLGRCEEEFTRQNRAWRTILAPHTRVGPWHPEGLLSADAPGSNIEVVFEPSKTRVGEFLVAAFSDGLKGFADDLAKTYALPRDLKVIYKDCGELNAWYSPREGTITMCYDLIEELAVMISDIEMGTTNGEETGNTSQSSGSASAAPQTASLGGATAASSGEFNGMDESADLGVPPTNVLFPAPYRGATPRENTRAKVVTTADLAQLIGDGKAFILVDTSGRPQTLPGAVSVVDAGKDGSLTDSFQSVVDKWLQDETKNDKSMPVIFFGTGLQDRSSYNAALRAGNLGWNVLWYRGGAEAWEANGLPFAKQQ